MMPPNLDPKTMMELSRLIQQLPPEKINQMQSLMHNMMAGFDVRKELEEFERSLPPGFREKMVSLMASSGMAAPQPIEAERATAPSGDMSEREARLTILRAVSEGRMTPEEAEKLLA